MTAATFLAAALLAGAQSAEPAASGPASEPQPPISAEPATTVPPPPSPPAPAPTPAAGTDEIVVSGRQEPVPGDPAEQINEASFQMVQGVDKAIVGPVATIYEKGTPKQLRKGLRNVLNNLSEPINAVNYLLQLKPGKAVKTLGRFTLNTAFGLGGLIDVAAKKPFNLPYYRNGFGNTFGYYGIKPGPYMYLPLVGPTSLRDLTGRLLDLSLVPRLAGPPFDSPAYAMGTGVVRSLDERVALDEFIRRLHHDCSNPYAAEREWYLATREAEIESLHGRKLDLTGRLPDCLVPAPEPAEPEARAPAPVQDQPDTPPVGPLMRMAF